MRANSTRLKVGASSLKRRGVESGAESTLIGGVSQLMTHRDLQKSKMSQTKNLKAGIDADEYIEHHHIEESETPRPAAQPGRVILVALDQSPYSEHALKWSLENLIRSDNNDTVVLTTVREPVVVPGSLGMSVGYIDFGEYISEAEEQARKQAHSIIKRYGQKVLKHFQLPAASTDKLTVRGIVMRGDPRDELVRKAQELNACALVIGSRGLGSFKRALLGSVSDYIVHHSSVPVIVVKAPEEHAEKK